MGLAFKQEGLANGDGYKLGPYPKIWPIDRQLWEIAENLIRAELTERFTAATEKATGLNESTIQRSVRRSEKTAGLGNQHARLDAPKAIQQNNLYERTSNWADDYEFASLSRKGKPA